MHPVKPNPSSKSARRRSVWALTAIRLALIPPIIATLMSSPIATVVFLGLFMTLDLGDGVLARRMHRDDVARRSLDSVIDRIGIDACLIGAGAIGAMPIVLVLGFLARDLYCALICIRMVRERRVVIKADVFYRGLNVLIAAWALSAPLLTSDQRKDAALGVFVCSVVVAVDLRRMVRAVREAPSSVSNCVIAPRQLRASPLGRETSVGDARRFVTVSPTATGI